MLCYSRINHECMAFDIVIDFGQPVGYGIRYTVRYRRYRFLTQGCSLNTHHTVSCISRHWRAWEGYVSAAIRPLVEGKGNVDADTARKVSQLLLLDGSEESRQGSEPSQATAQPSCCCNLCHRLL